MVERLIRYDLSPEQISDRLKKKRGVLIRHERIYQPILADKRVGGDLYRNLLCQKKCRKRHGSYDRRGVLPYRVSIDECPAKRLEANIYFAHPYAAWERGTNENSNGLVRQYFPKPRDFLTITDEETRMAECRLNNRPRNCLDVDTPNEVFFQSSSVVALRS